MIQLLQAHEILNNPSRVTNHKGLYALVAKEGLERLSRWAWIEAENSDPLVWIDGLPCLYLGKALDVQKRLMTHLCGCTLNSGVRLTFAAMLNEEIDLLPKRFERLLGNDLGKSEHRLTSWLSTNVSAAVIQSENPCKEEKQILERISLPLNVKGQTRHAYSRIVSEKRQQFFSRASRNLNRA